MPMYSTLWGDFFWIFRKISEEDCERFFFRVGGSFSGAGFRRVVLRERERTLRRYFPIS